MKAEEIIKNSDYNDEKILILTKQHPWYFTKTIYFSVIFIIAVLVSYYFFAFNKVTMYLLSIGIIANILFFVYEYYTWLKTYYIVTNHRVITYDQTGFFSKIMKEVTLQNILFISHEIKGPVNNFLDRGNLHIRSSGVTEDEMVFKNISSPYDVEKQISHAQKNSSKKENNDVKNKENRTIIR